MPPRKNPRRRPGKASAADVNELATTAVEIRAARNLDTGASFGVGLSEE
jgi:hypothetical protein